MPQVSFTPNLQRHVTCPDMTVEATTVDAALEAVFLKNPRLRSYILNDQGSLHRHMVILVNGNPVRDREKLKQPVKPDDEIYVVQSLSGG